MPKGVGEWPIVAALFCALAAGCETRPPVQGQDGQPQRTDLYRPPAPDTWRPPPDQWVRPDMSLPPDQGSPLPDDLWPQPELGVPDQASPPLCVPRGIKSPCYTAFKAALVGCACSSAPGATISACLGNFSGSPYYQAALSLAACLEAHCSPVCANGGYDAMFTCGPAQCKAQVACCLADGA